ncbi:FAD-linked oxidase C-terminal domain-containing protein [Plantactinospora sp. KBS50]|uniref:FAD-linked oxidase C-terminal domain-containing protein n=1 Tax=Plantactinospora sp. KBS50 TaxID=2024580 RepID=UPI001E5FBF64|nr:FAD-linked oxidase C-terminal domain-containing protein [Plantactinospora sp. KBS50]
MTLRLVRTPEWERVVLATFDRQEPALATVTRAFDLGLLPSAMDMLTGGYVPGRSDFADPSLLFVGLAGHREEVEEQAGALVAAVTGNGGDAQVLEVAEFLRRRAELVRDKVRRMVAATGRPRYYLFDATAPRSRLADLMALIRESAREFDLPVLNTFHAGDGNVHPTPFYDPNRADHEQRLRDFSRRILLGCAAMGGALTGEHGVGLEKRELMPEFFAPEVLRAMHGIRRVFDPDGLSNPGKLLPPEPPPPSPSTAPPPSPAPVLPPSTAPSPAADRRPAAPIRVNLVDAYLEVDDPGTTFAQVAALLAGTPYELCYEPLGGHDGDPVLDAVDAGRPGLREPHPIAPRDLILGVRVGGLALGGTVTKDVAGYELRKLVYGGRGRLGGLRGLRLRLTPRPSDSRPVWSQPVPVPDAVRLVRRVHRAGLPLAYLGMLVGAGTATVCGRLELRGGRLDRHLRRLRAEHPEVDWRTGDHGRWDDLPMRWLRRPDRSGIGCTDGTPWQAGGPPVGTLVDAYASAGHGRTWSAAVRPGPATGSERAATAALCAGVAAVFEAAR